MLHQLPKRGGSRRRRDDQTPKRETFKIMALGSFFGSLPHRVSVSPERAAAAAAAAMAMVS